MSNQFVVPKYGVIEHQKSYPQKHKKATKTGLREWLMVDSPCFYIKDRACRFTDIILMKDSANRFVLAMKYGKVTFAITSSGSGVRVSTYKNAESYTDDETAMLKGNMRTLTKGLSSNAVFSVAMELFPVEKMTPLYSYIHLDSEQKAKTKHPKPPKARPYRPAVLIKKNDSN